MVGVGPAGVVILENYGNKEGDVEGVRGCVSWGDTRVVSENHVMRRGSAWLRLRRRIFRVGARDGGSRAMSTSFKTWLGVPRKSRGYPVFFFRSI